MTPPKPAAGKPSASGVRRGGDRFQDLFVWAAAMQVMRPDSKFSQVEFEIRGAGNVDDVVLRSAVGDSDVYGQVKWATQASEPLGEDFLFFRKSRSGKPVGKSVLQKLYDSYVQLRAAGSAFTLRLITNRALDSGHPLLDNVDGRTQLLVPHAAQAGSNTAAGRAVNAWADHVGASPESLLDMLAHLEFQPGRTIPAEREHVRALMVAAGLDDSDAALLHGRDIVADWVVDGKRVVAAKDIDEAVDERGLRRVDPSAILVVQAIDIDPHADEATIALDWVDLYEGDQPGVRIQPRDPSGWDQMDHDIADAAAVLEEAGWRSTLVRGALRQATFFRVGLALPGVRGHTLRYMQWGQWWSTDAPKAPIDRPATSYTHVGVGSELAVAVGVAINPTVAVADYLQSEQIPVAELVTIQPADGADDQAVAGAGQAVAYAQQIRDLVRLELDGRPGTRRVHLFLAGPGGLALLLGHRWNRIRPTVVYEHLGPGRGYTRAFTVDV